MCKQREEKVSKVWFEPCHCEAEVSFGAHGYFHDSEKGVFAVPTLSMETADVVLNSLAEERNLTPDEVAAVRAQVKAAGLQEKMGSVEARIISDVTLEQMLGGLLQELGDLGELEELFG